MKTNGVWRIYPLTDRDKDIIVSMYKCDKLSTGAIAEIFGRSRSCIWRTLKDRGVDSSKANASILVTCQTCGKEFSRTRGRTIGTIRQFCGVECYQGWLDINGGLDYKPDRHGQRKGRSVVERHYGPLPALCVVHHVNGNCRDNNPENLILFATQGDHVKHHRGLGSTPLWVGSLACASREE